MVTVTGEIPVPKCTRYSFQKIETKESFSNQKLRSKEQDESMQQKRFMCNREAGCGKRHFEKVRRNMKTGNTSTHCDGKECLEHTVQRLLSQLARDQRRKKRGRPGYQILDTLRPVINANRFKDTEAT